MSSLYNLEPQPTASCILRTTSGDISLELWAKQVPLTCRNFLQLCLDGYYDNTIFHRLVPGFILQGGDPTGSGSGGESIYDGGAFSESRESNGVWPMEERSGANGGMQGVGFKDEFHSRIKFNRRGLLGMANEGPNTNGSQFFLTLGPTPELQGKNTLFGRVEGDTIYNVAKMGEAEVGEGDRPLYPVRITGVEVLVNPFSDMVIRKRTAEPIKDEKFGEKKKKRKIGTQLLSFGADADSGDAGDAIPALKKTKFDPRVVTDAEAHKSTHQNPKLSMKESRGAFSNSQSAGSSPERASAISYPIPVPDKKVDNRDISFSPQPPVQKLSSLLERTNAQIAELRASMKRNVPTAVVYEKKSALEEMIPSTSVKGRKRHRGDAAASADDKQALSILTAFRSKLEQAPPEKVNPTATTAEDNTEAKGIADTDGDDTLCDLHFITNCQSCMSWDAHAEADDQADDNDMAWMSHALSFKEDKLGKDLSYRKKAEDELVVIDPREKAKTLKEEKKAQREARSGGSGRAWDLARNEKLARASALAGRGAK